MARALAVNKTKWPLLLFAGNYYRSVADAPKAVECLRKAFYFAPAILKDIPALALAHTMHRAGNTVDAIILTQMAIQIAPRHPISHITMANLLVSIDDDTVNVSCGGLIGRRWEGGEGGEGVEEELRIERLVSLQDAAYFYETSLRLQPSLALPLFLLEHLRCRQQRT